jgi:predicted Zn-dependent protease
MVLLRIAVVLVMAVLPVSCAAIGRLNMLSTADEIEIGQQAANYVENNLAMLEDREVIEYVRDLGQSLAAHSMRKDVTYIFNVVDTKDVNAFALPGGWLYVNAGLIATADSESELAGVLSHEIGHIVGRHGARQITAQYGLSILTDIVGGGPNNDSIAREITRQVTGLGAGLTLLKYSRDMEREADKIAVAQTYAAGIDPVGIGQFFRKLLVLHENEPGGVDILFATHPPTHERISHVRHEVEKLPTRVGLRRDTARFQQIRQMLSGYVDDE